MGEYPLWGFRLNGKPTHQPELKDRGTEATASADYS
jgi:hypothetical protein